MQFFRRILLRMRHVLDNIVEKIETHILYSVTFFQKSCRLRDNVQKYGGSREAAGNMAPARGTLDK